MISIDIFGADLTVPVRGSLRNAVITRFRPAQNCALCIGFVWRSQVPLAFSPDPVCRSVFHSAGVSPAASRIAPCARIAGETPALRNLFASHATNFGSFQDVKSGLQAGAERAEVS
jgi:hypothetical protein